LRAPVDNLVSNWAYMVMMSVSQLLVANGVRVHLQPCSSPDQNPPNSRGSLIAGSGDEVIKLGAGTPSAAAGAFFVRGGTQGSFDAARIELGNALVTFTQAPAIPRAAEIPSALVSEGVQSSAGSATVVSLGAKRAQADLGAGVVEVPSSSPADELRPFSDRTAVSDGVFARVEQDATDPVSVGLEE
jgi:hypothetical protein